MSSGLSFVPIISLVATVVVIVGLISHFTSNR